MEIATGGFSRENLMLAGCHDELKMQADSLPLGEGRGRRWRRAAGSSDSRTGCLSLLCLPVGTWGEGRIAVAVRERAPRLLRGRLLWSVDGGVRLRTNGSGVWTKFSTAIAAAENTFSQKIRGYDFYRGNSLDTIGNLARSFSTIEIPFSVIKVLISFLQYHCCDCTVPGC